MSVRVSGWLSGDLSVWHWSDIYWLCDVRVGDRIVQSFRHRVSGQAVETASA